MVSLKQIRYALAVEEFLHFKKAAESCAISQSALSTAITDMEKQLGFAVFERDNKKVLITPLGKQVLTYAKNIYLQMNDLTSLAGQMLCPLSSTLSIGMIPTIAPFILPLMLPPIKTHYPKLDLRVEEDQSHILVRKVLEGQLDCAILALPYDCSGLLSFSFWQENFYLVTHKDDRLSTKQCVTAKELGRSNLMLLKDGHCFKDHALKVCGMESDSGYETGGTSLSTLIQLVAGNLGTTLVPEMALEQLVNLNPHLSAIPIDEPGPHREIAFIVRPNYPGLENIEILKQLIRDELNRLGSDDRQSRT
ncbi:LysR substrate-binding domain-containing protein [Simiduia curdlanivorans]|uniref:LysR substrate-binding domain-containing protein n=1 Tax=Simiduia curdlanivorans TaxID=1492769 RepID=A0ABV8V602_9GAMM|nr:hydrogen peroxide-inducible genes activator [Simiduia curdlanivorans]MDN3638345.1 LysR substrate-binding domain-containing protein [Simiduia curdlanivorans]